MTSTAMPASPADAAARSHGAIAVSAGPGAAAHAERRMVVMLWALSRGLLLAVALWVMIGRRRSAHDVISAWDVAHFEAIATKGYADPIDRAFFPGLPLVLRVAHLVGLPMGFAGVLLAAACSLLAALALLRIGGGGLRGQVAAGLWLFAPTTVFTAVAYTEAPFCAAAFWAWERARSRHWGQAAVLAGLACSFRISGLFLIGALGLLALAQRDEPVARRLRDAATVALAALVLVAHMAYLHHLTGSWNAWFEAQQSGWNRGFTNPLDSLRHTLDSAKGSRWPGRPEVGTVFAGEVASMAVGLVCTAALLVRRRWAEAGWVGVQVFAFATSWWFMSVNRAVLLWFPLWLMAGELAVIGWSRQGAHEAPGIDERSVARAGLAVGTVLSVAGMLWWAWLYFTGAWAS